MIIETFTDEEERYVAELMSELGNVLAYSSFGREIFRDDLDTEKFETTMSSIQWLLDEVRSEWRRRMTPSEGRDSTAASALRYR